MNLPGDILPSLAAGDVGAPVPGDEAELAAVGGVAGPGAAPPPGEGPGKQGRHAACDMVTRPDSPSEEVTLLGR